MSHIYLTPASISYLNQLFLAVLITGYLVVRYFRQKSPPSMQQEFLLLVFFITLSVFSFLLFLDVSLLPTGRLYAVYLQNTTLGVFLVVLIQFAYYFPAPKEKQKYERWASFILSGAYTLGEAGFAIWRFSLLRTGRVEYRPEWADILPAIGFLWVIFLFARGAIQNWHLPTSRRFALIFIIPFWLAVLNLMRTFYTVSTPFYHINMSVGILLVIFIFVLNYLTSQPEKTLFTTKLSGAVLTAVLALFGTVAWLVTPAYAAQYLPNLPGHRTIHFVPNQQGGYDVGNVPFRFDSDLGTDMGLTDAPNKSPFKAVEFNFPFFGKQYQKIFISNDGVIGMGETPGYKDYQFNLGRVPDIFPLLIDLIPEKSVGGGVFLRREPEHIVITWKDVPAFYHPEEIYTFQVILYSDGSFDITYAGLPDKMRFYSDDHPEAAVWAIGIKPAIAPSRNTDFSSLPLKSGPEGLIQDEYRAFRGYLDSFLRPLAAAILISNLLIPIMLSVLFRYGFAGPMDSLLKGVQSLNEGRRDVSIPVKFNDEIGFLTQSFNDLSGELNGLIKDLEKRVSNRTSDLRAANEQLRKLSIAVEQSPSAIVITNTEACIEYVNPAFTRSTGYTFEDVREKNPRILKSELTPLETYTQMWATLLKGQTWRGELVNKKKNGENYREYTVISPIYDDNAQITHYVAIKEDVTERHKTEQALRQSEEQYRQLFEMESDAIFIIRNSDGQILEANKAASALYGFSHEEILTMRNTDLSAEPEATQKATKSPAPSDSTIRIPLRWHHKKDGVHFPVGITARFVSWRGESVHIAAIRDITEQYRIEQELVHLAVTDALTSLPNRRHFLSQAEQIFARSTQPPYGLSMMMIDLDFFKKFNDEYGHATGDKVLYEVARILEANLRSTDLLARVGGEEFAILLPRTFSTEACQIAERLRLDVANRSIAIKNFHLSVTVSIGVAGLDDTIPNLDELLSRADQALYAAKQAGRNCCKIWGSEEFTPG